MSHKAPGVTRRRFIIKSGVLGLTISSIPVLSHQAQAQGLVEATQVPVELSQQAENLDGAIIVGNPKGDVTIVEFFDYNCGYCKISAREIDQLLKSDPDIKYVLINLAVLGLPSVLAHKVALGFSALYGPKKYLQFHQKLFALKGTVDGDRALNEAQALGANREKLIEAANDQGVSLIMTNAVNLADNLGLAATPSFIVGVESYQGYVSLAQKKAIAARVRS